MRLAAFGIGVVLLSALSASAQTCPPGQPSSPWPGPAFVPTADCQGWVPANHPQAPTTIHLPGPTGEVPAAAAQNIYSGFTGVPATVRASQGGLQAIAGWATDCALGTFPPAFKLIEVKPDGSSREIPNDYFWVSTSDRPDIQAAVGAACPAVYNVPLSDGNSAGPNTRFGWSMLFRSPITELGVHTFTVIASWPSKNHSGSSSVAVTIVP